MMKTREGLNIVVDAIIHAAGDIDDLSYFDDAINVAERLHVSLICMLVLSTSKKHEGHDCELLKGLPEYIEQCKTDFIKALDHHVDINCALNGVQLHKTHNQQTAEEILKELKENE